MVAKLQGKTPRAMGYRMPAEWEPHEATWLAWPHNPEDWPGKFSSIPWLYVEIVRLLAARERVHLIVEDAAMQKRVARMLERAGVTLEQVSFHRWPTDRGWTRDSGPIFVRNAKGQVGLTNWKFNAWAKYDDWRLDCKIPGRVTKLLGFPAWEPHIQNQNSTKCIVLEGGSIDADGAGTLLTTEECLLSEVQQRNPSVSREQLEQVFADFLGIDQVIWLGRGIAGDDTHGHVDDIARFAAPGTIVAAVEPNASDPNHAPLKENLKRLRAARSLDGKQFTIVELPMPRPIIFRGQRLPASYANFYIANGLVLVPTFHDPNDRVALNTLAEVFPDREIIGIHCVDLIWGLGALHCMTQQQPATHPTNMGPVRGDPGSSSIKIMIDVPINDREAMQAALAEARLAGEAGEVPIGAVVVCEGKIIARGQNRVLRDVDPTAHAEIVAMRAAAAALGNYRLSGCTLYVTLEPCAMCAGAMIHARLDGLVFAAADSKAGACGSVLSVINHPQLNHQMRVEQGIGAGESAELLRGFFRERR